jgi:hypothetical protein
MLEWKVVAIICSEGLHYRWLPNARRPLAGNRLCVAGTHAFAGGIGCSIHEARTGRLHRARACASDRAMTRLRDFLIDLSIMAFIALVLALMGPFGMFAVPLPIRILYWLVVGAGGYLLYRPAMMAATRAAIRLDLPVPALWAATCLLAGIPMTAILWFANGLLGRSGPPELAALFELYANILIVAGVVCIVFWFASAKQRAAMAAGDGTDAPLTAAPQPPASPPPVVDTPAPSPTIPFLDRLPLHLGTDLLALEMEDHYVRAYTLQGSALILLRLRDAIAELGAVDGAQVHRSWWVARDAIEAIGRDGRNIRLELRGGLIAPVARNAVPDLKARGWI